MELVEAETGKSFDDYMAQNYKRLCDVGSEAIAFLVALTGNAIAVMQPTTLDPRTWKPYFAAFPSPAAQASEWTLDWKGVLLFNASGHYWAILPQVYLHCYTTV